MWWAKNSLLGRVLAEFTHPLILEYIESDTFQEWVNARKDDYWSYFKRKFEGCRNNKKAWVERDHPSQEGWRAHQWGNFIQFWVNEEARDCRVFLMKHETHLKRVFCELSNIHHVTLTREGPLHPAIELRTRWSEDPEYKAIKRQDLPRHTMEVEYDEWGNITQHKRHIWAEIEKLKVECPYSKEELDIALKERQAWVELHYRVHNALFREASLKWFKLTPIKLVHKLWRHIVWDVLDRECLSITTKAFGINASLGNYRTIWRNKEAYAEIAKVAPGLVPLVHTFFPRPKMGHRLMPTIKRMLHGAGMTKAEWKYLIKMPVGTSQLIARMLVDPVRHTTDTVQTKRRARKYDTIRMVELFRFLKATGEYPRRTIWMYLAVHLQEMLFHTRHGPRMNNAMHYCRALFRATAKARGITRKWWMKHHGHAAGQRDRVRHWDEQISNSWDYLLRARDYNLTREQLRAPWNGWLRLSAEWHENMHREIYLRDHGDHTWKSLVDTVENKLYRKLKAVALTSTKDLFEEGRKMHHCVGSYSSQCVRGLSRIFSILEDGEPASTVEISLPYHAVNSDEELQAAQWEVRQNYGYCNKRAEGSVRDFGCLVRDIYNEEWDKLSLEEKKVELTGEIDVHQKRVRHRREAEEHDADQAREYIPIPGPNMGCEDMYTPDGGAMVERREHLVPIEDAMAVRGPDDPYHAPEVIGAPDYVDDDRMPF